MAAAYFCPAMLGQELRKARLAAGLTQEKLALRARMDRSYLSELERDLKSPTVAMLLRMCEVMGVSAAELLGRVEKRPPSRPKH